MGGEAEEKMHGQFFVHIELRIVINSNTSKYNCKSSLSMGV